jgi:hypothetical protein
MKPMRIIKPANWIKSKSRTELRLCGNMAHSGAYRVPVFDVFRRQLSRFGD